MMSKENIFLILPEYYSNDIPLFGLVESCFNGMTYYELKKRIILRLENISQILSLWLRIKITNPQKF